MTEIALWVDDERPLPNGYDVVATNVGDAKKVLETGRVTRISLDYYLGSGCDTGHDLAKWIREQAEAGLLPKIRCTVHSHSEEGRRLMKVELRKAMEAWNPALKRDTE